MAEWTEYSIEVAQRLLREKGFGAGLFREFEDVASYCRGITYSVMGGRRVPNPEIELHLDIERWLNDETGKTLNQFELNTSRRISFQLG